MCEGLTIRQIALSPKHNQSVRDIGRLYDFGATSQQRREGSQDLAGRAASLAGKIPNATGRPEENIKEVLTLTGYQNTRNIARALDMETLENNVRQPQLWGPPNVLVEHS
jgi:hypothetical protein